MPNGEETETTNQQPSYGAATWAGARSNLRKDLRYEQQELEEAMRKMGLNQSIGSFAGTALAMMLFPGAPVFLKPLIAGGGSLIGGKVGGALTPDKIQGILDEDYGTYYGDERDEFGDILKADLWKGALKSGANVLMKDMAAGHWDKFNKAGGVKGWWQDLKKPSLETMRGWEGEWDAMQNLGEIERVKNLFPDASVEDKSLWGKLFSGRKGSFNPLEALGEKIGSAFHKEQVGYDALGNRVTQKLDISGNVIPDSGAAGFSDPGSLSNAMRDFLGIDEGFEPAPDMGPQTTDIGFEPPLSVGPQTTDMGFKPSPDMGPQTTDVGFEPSPDIGAQDMFTIQSQLVSDLIGTAPAAADSTVAGTVNLVNLASMINPANANPTLVGQFQQAVMGLAPGDPGYGILGPQTTAIWKQIMGYGR